MGRGSEVSQGNKVLCARRRPTVSDCFTPACCDSRTRPLVLFILYLVYPSVTDTRPTKKMDRLEKNTNFFCSFFPPSSLNTCNFTKAKKKDVFAGATRAGVQGRFTPTVSDGFIIPIPRLCLKPGRAGPRPIH